MNKREEVFTTLCEYNIVMVRAAWYIKMAAAYAVTISETKIKKRQTVDPSIGEQEPSRVRSFRKMSVENVCCAKSTDKERRYGFFCEKFRKIQPQTISIRMIR